MKAVAKVDIVDGKCVVIYSDGSEQELYEVTENSEIIEQITQDIALNTAAIAALNSKRTVTLSAGNNVTIDENKSYAVGKMLFLSVKGHATANIENTELFTISNNVSVNPTAYTFFCGLGTAWNIGSVGYCYINSNKVSGRVSSGQYFHVCVTIPIN